MEATLHQWTSVPVSVTVFRCLIVACQAILRFYEVLSRVWNWMTTCLRACLRACLRVFNRSIDNCRYYVVTQNWPAPLRRSFMLMLSTMQLAIYAWILFRAPYGHWEPNEVPSQVRRHHIESFAHEWKVVAMIQAQQLSNCPADAFADYWLQRLGHDIYPDDDGFMISTDVARSALDHLFVDLGQKGMGEGTCVSFHLKQTLYESLENNDHHRRIVGQGYSIIDRFGFHAPHRPLFMLMHAMLILLITIVTLIVQCNWYVRVLHV